MAATDFVLEGQLLALVTTIKGSVTSLDTQQGALATLTTTAKASLVAAINELAARPTGPLGAQINDTLANTTTTWSGSKTTAAIVAAVAAIPQTPGVLDSATNTVNPWSGSKTNTAISAAITALIGGAPAALDTLKELSTALGDNASYAATITTALGLRLRVDAAQGLTAPQKAQGLSNLGISTSTADFAALFAAA